MSERRMGSVGSRLFSATLVFLFASAIYLFAFPQPNILYAGVVLAHALVGVCATVLLVPALWRAVRTQTLGNSLAWALLFAGALVGLWLLRAGTSRPQWNWLYAHIVLSAAGVAIAVAVWWNRHAGSSLSAALVRLVVCLAVLAGLGAGAWYLRQSRWQNSLKIENPAMPPATMEGE